MSSGKVSSVAIVQRQTVDWASLDEDDFIKQSIVFCRLWGKPDDYVQRLYLLWNQTFAIDYCEVRSRIKELSSRSCNQVASAEFVEYQQYCNIPESANYYIFVDDDDWVAPDMVERLSEMTDAELVLWRSANIGSPTQQHTVFVWGMNGRCMTNNYAVGRRWLEPFSRIRDVIQHKHSP
jgi:hypothetical protein